MADERWFKPIEGRKRTLSGFYAVFYAVIAAFFSLWYLYTSGFGRPRGAERALGPGQD